jgi:hypothetical protein
MMLLEEHLIKVEVLLKMKGWSKDKNAATLNQHPPSHNVG